MRAGRASRTARAAPWILAQVVRVPVAMVALPVTVTPNLDQPASKTQVALHPYRQLFVAHGPQLSQRWRRHGAATDAAYSALRLADQSCPRTCASTSAGTVHNFWNPRHGTGVGSTCNALHVQPKRPTNQPDSCLVDAPA
jgi:hypothetical protein